MSVAAPGQPGLKARARRLFEEAALVYMSAGHPLDAARCRTSESAERRVGTAR